jgi:hypothetical protein
MANRANPRPKRIVVKDDKSGGFTRSYEEHTFGIGGAKEFLLARSDFPLETVIWPTIPFCMREKARLLISH